MEAAVVSVSRGAIGSLLGKLGDLLAGQYKLLKEAKGEIMFLKAELESMRVFLERMSDAEEEADKQSKCWAEGVRDLSYDIEDNIDDFMLRVECESNSKPHGFKGFIERSINLLTTINFRHKIGKELQGLKRRVMEVSDRRMRYKVDGTVAKPNNTAIDILLLALYADTAGLVGFDLGMNSIGNIRDLGDLTNLKDLEICRVYRKQLDETEATKLMNILRFSLEKLCNLKYLCKESYLPSACSDALSSLSASPHLLRRLHLRGCMLSSVPKWIRELHNLYDLALGVKQVLEDDVGIIALPYPPECVHLWNS